MDPLIVNSVSLLLGAGITYVVTTLQSRRTRDWQIEDFARQQKAMRDQEVRSRADVKAQEALEATEELDRLLVAPIRLHAYLWPKDREDRRAARQALDRLSQAALYIQQPLRTHLELAVRVLSQADQLGSGGWHRDSPWTIGRVILQSSRRNIGRYLRNEHVPTDMSSKEEEYDEALGRLEEYEDHQMQRAIEAEERLLAESKDGGEGEEPPSDAAVSER